MSIQTIAVLGAGAMGSGICEAAALAGLNVISIETAEPQRAAARKRIQASLAKGIEKKKLTITSPDEVLERIRWQPDVSAAAEAQFVVEAVSENEDLKRSLFAQLGQLCPPETILSSNTSSISITKLGAASGRPDRVVGMHFFNPVPIMKPVEVVRGLETSEAVIAATVELAKRMGKTGLVVRDAPGFVVNRVLMPLINEAVFTLEEGIAEPAAIDELMRLGCNHPMGPLELADFIGLDVVLAILEVLFTQIGDPKFRPASLLRRKVDAGHLGRKSGRGFYEYPAK